MLKIRERKSNVKGNRSRNRRDNNENLRTIEGNNSVRIEKKDSCKKNKERIGKKKKKKLRILRENRKERKKRRR
jgi:hypothetical protein